LRAAKRPNRRAVKKVVIINIIHEAGLRVLEAREDAALTVVGEPDPKSVRRELADAHGVIVRTYPIDRTLIEASPQLEVVSRHGVGYDNVDVTALDERRIPLTIVGDVNAVPVAEQALFMMLALAKKGTAMDRAVRTDNFGRRDTSGMTELWRKSVLILGFGRIGRQVAARCRAFDMTVLAYDPYIDSATIEAAGCRAVADYRGALGEVDIVTLHMPLGPETTNMIGAAELAAMKPSAFLINVARGGLADEVALEAALREGRIAGAGLDVFASEPPAPDNPLLTLENLIMSPHSAGLSEECRERMAVACADNVLAVFDGTIERRLVVNAEAL
jgi:D-3-phosphoglycerate dehydrogenase